jgi:hypothetical protein
MPFYQNAFRLNVATPLFTLLYSFSGTKGFMGEPAVSPTYCPINGAYSFTYSVNDGTENSLECSGKSSEISDCPYGFGFNLKFRDCSFGNMGKLILLVPVNSIDTYIVRSPLREKIYV